MKTFQIIIVYFTGLLMTTFSASASDTLTTEHGIKYVQLSEGSGAHPTTHQQVKIIYSLRSSTGEILESNEDFRLFKYRVGDDKMIEGLDEIIKQMNQGEEVYCIIPPSLGHGEKGVSGYINPNETLYLYIQIVEIK